MGRFGAYISHLTAMTEDSSVMPAGKKKMKAYVKKWQGSKVRYFQYVHETPSHSISKTFHPHNF